VLLFLIPPVVATALSRKARCGTGLKLEGKKGLLWSLKNTVTQYVLINQYQLFYPHILQFGNCPNSPVIICIHGLPFGKERCLEFASLIRTHSVFSMQLVSSVTFQNST